MQTPRRQPGLVLPATLVAGLIAAPLLAFGQTGPAPAPGSTASPPAATAPSTIAPGGAPAPGAGRSSTTSTTVPTPGAAGGATTTTTTTTQRSVTGSPTNRASRIIGANVHNERNETVGEIEDLILNTSGGAPTAIISVGGFLGMGARLVAVPLSELSFNTQREHWMLNGATKESLQARPAYTYQRS